MPWPIVILRDNGWEACALESSAPYPTPAHDATFAERIRHYVEVHQYREISEKETRETGTNGKPFRVVFMEHV